MRLIRFGRWRAERPGILDADDVRRDASSLVSDWNGAALARLDDLLRSVDPRSLPRVPDDARWGSCVARPGKLICIGLNYSDHAHESNLPIPSEPIVFHKGTDTVVGPYDDVRIPRGSTKTDWEVELGVVVGREARYLPDTDAANRCIAGYCVSHDVSERAFQLERGGQWTKGKSCETFNPLGPWLATPDEIADPQALAMATDVNGEPRQRGTTATMIFAAREIVRYLSQFMVLEPGDVISTGTPPGVGMGRKPQPQYLRVGDVVELSIERLGRQRQRFVAAP